MFQVSSFSPLLADGYRLKVTYRTVGHSACLMARVSVTVRGWIMRSGDPSVSLVGLVMDLVSAGMIRASQAECGPRFIHQFLAWEFNLEACTSGLVCVTHIFTLFFTFVVFIHHSSHFTHMDLSPVLWVKRCSTDCFNCLNYLQQKWRYIKILFDLIWFDIPNQWNQTVYE